MAYYLRQHPDIFAPKLKEPMHFGSDLLTKSTRMTEKQYLMLYSGWTEERYGLDASTAYLASGAAPGEIYSKSPDAKILVMVRNPIDAAYSLYWQNRSDMAEDLTTFEQSLDAEEGRLKSGVIPRVGRLDRTLYSKIFAFTDNIKNFQRVFSAKNINIIVFDDLKENPDASLLGVFDFLNISAEGNYSLELKNPASTPRSSRIAKFISDPPDLLKSTVRAMIPFNSRLAIRQAISRVNLRKEPYPPMKAETRKMLVAKFSQELSRLSYLIGRDMSHWLEVDE